MLTEVCGTFVFQNGGRHSEGHFDGGERSELGPGGHDARPSGEQGGDGVQVVQTAMDRFGPVRSVLGFQRHAVDPVLDHCRRHSQVLRRQLPRHRLDLYDLHDHLHPAYLPSFVDTHQKGQAHQKKKKKKLSSKVFCQKPDFCIFSKGEFLGCLKFFKLIISSTTRSEFQRKLSYFSHSRDCTIYLPPVDLRHAGGALFLCIDGAQKIEL